MDKLNHRQRRVLQDIFDEPARSDVAWNDVEGLLLALGASRSEGRGSRIRFLLNGVPAVFHRPHPHREIGKGTVKAVRKFLSDAGVGPC